QMLQSAPITASGRTWANAQMRVRAPMVADSHRARGWTNTASESFGEDMADHAIRKRLSGACYPSVRVMEGVGSGRRGRFSTVAPVLLLVAAGLALAVRVVSIAEPLGIDQSLWASAVRGMSRGQLLYTDVWEQRPPGIYLSYWIAFGLFGWTSAAVAWLDLAASACAVVLLWAIGRRLDGPLAGALAAALYAVFTIPAGLHGYGGLLERAVCETFIIVAVAGAALCATSVRGRDSCLPAVAAGLCCGAAVVYKPNAGVYLPAILAWIVCYRFD